MKKGMTLIESVITIALLGIVFLLATPLIRSFGGVNDRVRTQKEIDAEFLVINEFIQEKVRAAKRTDKKTTFTGADEGTFHDSLKYASIYREFPSANTANSLFASGNRADEGELGNVLVLEIPFEEEIGEDNDIDGERLESQFEIFAFIDGALKYKVINYANGALGNFETLIESVETYPGPYPPTNNVDKDVQLEKSSFKLDKGIIVYYINLDIGDSGGKFRDSLRESASTRIDINY